MKTQPSAMTSINAHDSASLYSRAQMMRREAGGSEEVHHEHGETIADYARFLELRDWFSQAYPDAPCRIRARAMQLFADVCGVR